MAGKRKEMGGKEGVRLILLIEQCNNIVAT